MAMLLSIDDMLTILHRRGDEEHFEFQMEAWELTLKIASHLGPTELMCLKGHRYNQVTGTENVNLEISDIDSMLMELSKTHGNANVEQVRERYKEASDLAGRMIEYIDPNLDIDLSYIAKGGPAYVHVYADHHGQPVPDYLKEFNDGGWEESVSEDYEPDISPAVDPVNTPPVDRLTEWDQRLAVLEARRSRTPPVDTPTVDPVDTVAPTPPVDRLTGFMRRKGISRTGLARSLHVGKSFVTFLLQGERRPSLDTAARIERLTGGAIMAAEWAEID